MWMIMRKNHSGGDEMTLGVTGDISYGWACRECGVWVLPEIDHICPPSVSITIGENLLLESDEERKIKALERIANSLEKIAKRK